MKKIFLCLLSVILVTAFCIVGISAKSESMNWYCVRRKDHKQPIADSNMQFIEQYNGFYIDHKHDDNNTEKIVYLTFDAGYENGNISRILDTLKEENVHGAFFILENLINKDLDLVKRMIQEGHTVANHTANHKDMTKFSNIEDFKEEIESLEKIYYEATGCNMPKYFRYPEGKFSQRSMQYLNDLGYKTIFWSFAYADWDNNNQMSPEEAKSKILSNIHNGAVLLLHPTSKTNADILKDVIVELKELGYKFGTLDELTGNIA